MTSITGGILPKHIKYNVVIPTLEYLNLGGKRAINLITGTIFSESYVNNYTYLRQQNNGKAFSIIQMESNTYNDIWNNYLIKKPKYSSLIKNMVGTYNLNKNNIPNIENTIGNLFLAVAMCRMHYLRVYEQIPDFDNALELAKYYKKYYNTYKGKAKVEEKLDYFKLAITL